MYEAEGDVFEQAINDELKQDYKSLLSANPRLKYEKIKASNFNISKFNFFFNSNVASCEI